MQDSEITELAEEIRKELRELPSRNPEHCIGRVGKRLKEDHRGAYIPMTISIGSLHHNRRDLSTMEKYKRQYTKSFLQQTPHLFLEDYLKALKRIEAKARRCYGEQIDLHSNRFKKMMLYDGCFIIQLFLRFKNEVPRSENDPIFWRIGLIKRIKRDMILLENQLPFFVLQCLFNISTVFNGGPSLIDLALEFFSDIIPGHNKRIPQQKGAHIKHLLDLLRHSLKPPWVDEDEHPLENNPEVLIHSTVNLQIKCGVKFKMATKAESLLDIKFHSNGWIEIPPLKLQEETETLFRNFMAFEQCRDKSNAYITDYISFMGGLIKEWDDANLLCDIGILESHLPCDPLAITDFFGNLSKELVVYNCYYSKLLHKVNFPCIRPHSFIYDCCSIVNVKTVGLFLLFISLAWLHFLLN